MLAMMKHTLTIAASLVLASLALGIQLLIILSFIKLLIGG